jgi:hypothetical protein
VGDEPFRFELVFEHVPTDVVEIAPRRDETGKNERVPKSPLERAALACSRHELSDLGAGGAEEVLEAFARFTAEKEVQVVARVGVLVDADVEFARDRLESGFDVFSVLRMEQRKLALCAFGSEGDVKGELGRERAARFAAAFFSAASVAGFGRGLEEFELLRGHWVRRSYFGADEKEMENPPKMSGQYLLYAIK